MKEKITTLHILWFLSLLALLGFQFHYRFGAAPENNQKASKFKIGDKAPDFSLPARDGSQVDLKSLIKDKPCFIVFFSTDCPPCRMELKDMKTWKTNRMFTKDDSDIINIALVTGDRKSAIEEYEEEEGPIGFDVLFDKSGEASESYGVDAIPYSFLIGKDGRILMVERGARPQMLFMIRSILEDSSAPKNEYEDD